MREGLQRTSLLTLEAYDYKVSLVGASYDPYQVVVSVWEGSDDEGGAGQSNIDSVLVLVSVQIELHVFTLAPTLVVSPPELRRLSTVSFTWDIEYQ